MSFYSTFLFSFTEEDEMEHTKKRRISRHEEREKKKDVPALTINLTKNL